MMNTAIPKHPAFTKAFCLSSLLLALSGTEATWAGTLHSTQGAEQSAANSASVPDEKNLAFLESGSDSLHRAQTHQALMAALNHQVGQVSYLATQMASARDQLSHALASGDEHYIAVSQQSLDSYRQAFYQAQVAVRSRMKELQRFHADERAVD